MIDWARVEELRDEVGADEFAEVVEIFLDEVQEVMDRLAATPDPGRLRDDLHFLKGSAMSLGFAGFARLCAEGEATAARAGPEQVDIAALQEAYRRSRGDFLANLPGRDAA